LVFLQLPGQRDKGTNANWSSRYFRRGWFPRKRFVRLIVCFLLPLPLLLLQMRVLLLLLLLAYTLPHCPTVVVEVELAKKCV